MKKKSTKKLPRFKNYEEEVRFWDAHDVTDYGVRINPSMVKVSKPVKLTFSVRLENDTVNKLDSIAKEKGIGPATLARMWLLEKLKEEDRLKYNNK